LTGETLEHHGVQPLGLLDCTVLRNGYGRQIDSFTADLNLTSFNGSDQAYPAVFIRAPRIVEVGDGIEVLARYDGEPVVVRQGHLLGLTFHPELTDDCRIHKVFLQMAGPV